MTLKECLKSIVLIVIPVIVFACATAVTVVFATESPFVQSLITLFSTFIIIFGAIKWTCFLDDHDWI